MIGRLSARPYALLCLGLLCMILVACGGGSPTATARTLSSTNPATSTAGSASAVQPTSAASASAITPTLAAASSVAGAATTVTARGAAVAQGTAPQGSATSAAASSAAGNPSVRRDGFTVDFGDFQARAELTYPASGSGPFPTVILIPGTGPYDMDFTLIDRMTGQAKSHILLDIANYLSANGYAVARYNKHFISGPRDQLDPAALQRFYALPQKQLLADADTVYQTVKANPKVDPKQIIIYGWSEGTTHATQLVTTHPEIAGLVLQAPVAGSWKDTFSYQLLDVGVSFLRDVADTNKDGAVTLDEVLAALRGTPGTASGDAALMTLDLSQPPPASPAPGTASPSAPAAPKLNAVIDANKDGKLDIANEIVPFFQGFFANFDQNAGGSPYAQYTTDKALPTIVSSLPAYKGPVLILQGANDANVSPEGAKQIDDALATASNSDHTLINYPNLGHSLGQAPSRNADNFQPIDAKPLADTSAWLNKRFRK